jgi:hypothetical protein
MWDLWWTKRHWSRFSPSSSVSPANYSTNFSIIIITRDWNNRPIIGRSAEWTQLDSTNFRILGGKSSRYPFDKRLDGRVPEPVWTPWRREKSCNVGNRTRAFQPVTRHYTNWAIPTPVKVTYGLINKWQSLCVSAKVVRLCVCQVKHSQCLVKRTWQ